MIANRSTPWRKLHRLFALSAIGLVAPALTAGTPLICHPYAIGSAKSLPGGPDWHGVSRDYDRSRLVADTLALLTPETPIIVRMETLRRAAIYATSEMRNWDRQAYTEEDRAVASALLEKLRGRISDQNNPRDQALALFDAGFLAETLRHARMDLGVDGYALLTRAVRLRGEDPEMEFALALASSWPKRTGHEGHLARARRGAAEGSLLAANLASHFGRS